MKKLITLSLAIFVYFGNLFSQQVPEYTLYMMNPFIYNCALAGTHNYYQIRTNNRFQWIGFKDAPITNSLSVFGPHPDKDMGYGGNIYSDITGPISRTGVNGVYAYNFPINSEIRLSLGLTLGLMQYKIDGSKINFSPYTEIPSYDPSLSTNVVSKMRPDGSFGAYLWAQSFNVGLSAQQLFNLNTKFNAGVDGFSNLKTHFYLIGGYRYVLDYEWAIEPGAVFSKVISAPLQLELNAKVIYKNMLWTGLAFRTQDAVSLLFGYTHERKIYIAYAFDYALTAIRKYSAGSSEIVLGYNFDSIKKQRSGHGKRR